MNLLVSQETAQRVLNYLALRPYSEVYQLIPGLTNLQPGVPMNESVAQVLTQDNSISIEREQEAEEARQVAAQIHDHTNEK